MKFRGVQNMSAVIAKAALLTLLTQCQADVSPSILKRIIDVETHSKPYAIAVVGGGSIYPESLTDAVQSIETLEAQEKNYSVGLMQVNKHNFERYGLNKTNVFDACQNIKAGASIYAQCYYRAKEKHPKRAQADLLNDAASCYYSGNFLRGYKKESNGKSYVDKFSASSKIPKKMIAEAYSDENHLDESALENMSETPPKRSQWDVFGDF